MRLLPALAILVSVSLTASAADSVADASREKPVVLPEVTASDALKDFPLLSKRDVRPADVRGSITPADFPTRLRKNGVFEGKATVGVMLDAKGQAIDFLALRYTHREFADSLLESLRKERFTPRKVKKFAVPGPFMIGQQFDLGAPANPGDSTPGTIALSPSEAMTRNMEKVRHPDGPPIVYGPVPEASIDGGGLKLASHVTPRLPGGYPLVKGKPVKVLVQFFVDETGRVRLPDVLSAPAPEIIPGVIEAVAQWRFDPPKANGQPVLVQSLQGLTLGE